MIIRLDGMFASEQQVFLTNMAQITCLVHPKNVDFDIMQYLYYNRLVAIV